MHALRHTLHAMLLLLFGVCTLIGALLFAAVVAAMITYWFRAYGVVVMLILIDGVLGAFYGIPWLSVIGISWLLVSEITRPLLTISNQDTV